jgi:hypothetical protein
MTDQKSKARLDEPAQEYDLDSTIVSANENSSGGVDFDDLGHARWKWSTEASAASPPDVERTFDLLKALDNDTIELAERKQAESQPKAAKKTGYNPYDTGSDDSPPPTPANPKKR